MQLGPIDDALGRIPLLDVQPCDLLDALAGQHTRIIGRAATTVLKVAAPSGVRAALHTPNINFQMRGTWGPLAN